MTNDKLRAVFDGLELEDVASVLSSGNIVFRTAGADAPTLEQRIEDALARELGISSRTLLRSDTELRALVYSDPFPGATHDSRTYLTATFVKHPSPTLVVLGPMDEGTTIVRYDAAARAVLAITDNREPNRARSFMLWLEASYGKGITTRSWLTVQKINRTLENMSR